MYPQHKSSSKRQEEREWRDHWLGSSEPSYEQWDYLKHLECDDDYPIDFDAVLGEGCTFGDQSISTQTLSELLYGDMQYLRLLDLRFERFLQRGNILWLDPLG